MPDYFNKSHKEVGPELQGSVLRGILGSAAGMFVCILALLLCWLCRLEEFSITLLLFVGVVIGWFYRLFRGRRSKTAAYVTVGICTVSASVLWVALLALLSVFVSPAPFTAADWGRLWGEIWELLLLYAGLGMIGFFLTRRSLLAYADWKRGPWHIAYAGGNGYSYNLLPEFCVEENIRMPLYLNRVKTDKGYIRSLMEKLGIYELRLKFPSQLSGGEQQRAAIARALAARPDIVFADEPTGNLDQQSGGYVLRLLKMMKEEWGQTILLVTHDMEIAQAADRVIEIRDGMVVGRGA